ncbi:MAG: prolipoprotein diacylglyceryl transferase [Clostridiales Family XIII bacterium]|jgi:phosphatidylglycerol:prolipoprotein diacylglycerol transferase|nr:prolipoprotein diacylglyceryl transferase [Clostridiales Family XIII bacterium]
MMESPGRIAFAIGSFDVMWYGILVALGIVCGFLVVHYRAPKYHNISPDRTFNLLIIILITALVGTRAYYVIFEWEYYAANPGQILNFRAGGLAIHGGLIFGCLMALLLSRLWHEKFFNIVDVFFVGIPLGQAIGRWGNFFNSEAHGVHTDLPWSVIVNGDAVHPTFLYESIWCFILVLILWKVDNKRKFAGQTFLLYCILYSIERYFVEGLRTDSLIAHFPWGDYRQAQALSIIVIICAAIVYILLYRKSKRAGFPEVNAAYQSEAPVGSNAILPDGAPPDYEPRPETADEHEEAKEKESE